MTDSVTHNRNCHQHNTYLVFCNFSRLKKCQKVERGGFNYERTFKLKLKLETICCLKVSSLEWFQRMSLHDHQPIRLRAGVRLKLKYLVEKNHSSKCWKPRDRKMKNLKKKLKNSISQHSLGIIPLYQTANVFKWHSSAILCSNEIGAKCFTMHSNMFFLQLLLVFILSSPWDGSRPRISFCRSFILPVFQTIALTGSQALVSTLIGKRSSNEFCPMSVDLDIELRPGFQLMLIDLSLIGLYMYFWC